MNIFIRCIAVPLAGLIALSSQAQAAIAPSPSSISIEVSGSLPTTLVKHERLDLPRYPTFKHGDISWLPSLATQAGWPRSTWNKLGQIILRESGGCPNRAGGDMVDKNCNITGVSEWNHRSDTGLLQINGVHWKQDHAQYHGLVCKRLGVCEQSILLDPLTNLIAGKLLYDAAGWSPWDIG
ncbi:lysozyme-like domain containing protein [Freshwater phage uvFW-CGR-AMD-COM-C493]|nr:lysozyme-like domain containing protein [Freshwater phage uvFW-CGR-AMD-COM-C493]